MHWQTLRYQQGSKEDRRQLARWIAARAEVETDLLPLADEFFTDVLTRTKDLELIQIHLDFLEAAQVPIRLRRRLTSYSPTLRAKSGFEADFRMLRLHLLEGDLKASRELIRRLKRSYSELEGNEELAKLEERVEEMRRRIAQVNVDWDFDATVRQAGRLAESDPNELNRFLRQVMRDKAGALTQAEEANLYIGSGTKYQKAFTPYRAAYEQNLSDYLNLLEEQVGLSPEEKQVRFQELTLQTPQPQNGSGQKGTPAVRSFSLPATPKLDGLIEMEIGTRELLLESPNLRGPVVRAPPASVVSQGTTTVLQNSRSLALVQGTDLVWKNVWDNSHLTVDKEAIPWHRDLTPALSEDQIFARVLNEGGYQVIAVETDTGRVQWTWQEQDRVVCTNPVAWNNDVLFVARTTGQVSQYHLVFVDRHNGETQRELNLVTSSHIRWYQPA